MNLNATLIIEVVSFLILLGLLVRFLYRPLFNILDKRTQEVESANRMIQERLMLAEKGQEEARQILEESKAQALRIKERMGQEAERLREKILTSAREEARRMLRASQQEIIDETERAKEQIKAEAVDLSLQVAQKLLRRTFTPQDQKRLIKELIEEIDGRKSSG